MKTLTLECVVDRRAGTAEPSKLTVMGFFALSERKALHLMTSDNFGVVLGQSEVEKLAKRLNSWLRKQARK